MKTNKLQSLPPLINEDSEILILGTMPGNISLSRGEYYAASNNSFWKIIAVLYNNGKLFNSYEEKKECLKQNHIALWDTLHLCEREGSSDSSIKSEVCNDINALLNQYPQIRKIVFNGKKATQYYKSELPYFVANSTSNAYPIAFERKVGNWQIALETSKRVNLLQKDSPSTIQKHAIRSIAEEYTFDNIWEKYIIPLKGRTLSNSRGTNTIVNVDWNGVIRTTSTPKLKEKRNKIKIESFKLVVNKLLKEGSITREYIKNEAGRVSSAIVLILSQVPFFKVEGIAKRLVFIKK